MDKVDNVMVRRRKIRNTEKVKAQASSVPRYRQFWLYGVYLTVGVVVASVATMAITAWRADGMFPLELATGAAEDFNVLVITLDTTRADRLGCYGYAGARTPHLDSLAAEGVRFDDAVSVVPMTLPANTSMFTGLDPPHHGVRNNGEYYLAPSHTTLAELLRTRGYETAAFISAFVLDARYGLDQGFEHYDGNLDATTGAAFGQYNERSGSAVTASAIHWLNQRDRSRPFFAWVHYFDPHDPYIPPPPFAQQFARQPYDGEIAFMDAQIGLLLKALNDAGLKDRTLIIAVGDHGESLGEHHESTHALFIYEATQRVPLILSCAGLVRRGYVVDDVVVSITDIFPTVLDLLGIEYSGPCDGITLLQARRSKNRAVYLESLQPYLEHGWAPLHGLRRHFDKYILAPTPEYYDLRTDPKELHNLFMSLSGTAKSSASTLAAELEKRLKKSPDMRAVADAAVQPNQEALERLRTLGYVSGASMSLSVGEMDPKDMMPIWEMIRAARSLLESGRYGEALTKARKALAMSPSDRTVLQLIGEAHGLMGNYKKAEESFRAYIDIKPSSNVCILLAQVLMAQGRIAAADGPLNQAEKLEPWHGGIYIARGDALFMQGHIKEALAAYEKAVQIDPLRASGMAGLRIQRVRTLLSQDD